LGIATLLAPSENAKSGPRSDSVPNLFALELPWAKDHNHGPDFLKPLLGPGGVLVLGNAEWFDSLMPPTRIKF